MITEERGIRKRHRGGSRCGWRSERGSRFQRWCDA